MKSNSIASNVGIIFVTLLFSSLLLLGSSRQVFGLGEEVYIDGAEKGSEKVMEDLKPENRQEQRWKTYHDESVSYDARESARDPDQYWRQKRERENELLRNAQEDHSASDKKTRSRYKKLHDLIFGPKELKKN